MTWNLTGRMVESCSCRVMCPCWLPIDAVTMDQGWCASAFLFQIASGRSGKVDLSRRVVSVAMDFPGPTLSDGNATARVYLDDGATAAQRRELEPIFQGTRGGGMKGLGSGVSRWLPTKSVPISVRQGDDELVATIGPFGEVRSKVLRNKLAKIVRLHNVTLLGVTPIDLAPSASEWRDPEMPRFFRTESGGRGKFAWKG